MCNYMPVADVYAREILDSRGYPAIEVEVMTEDGSVGRAAIPYSTTPFPAGKETLPAGGEAFHTREACCQGDGLQDGCHFVNSVLADAMIGENVYEQAQLDRLLCHLDGSKKQPCADGILGVSLASAAAAAKTLNLPLYRYLGGMRAYCLPVPMMSVLCGGVHAANTLDFREFMIMPVKVDCYGQGLRMCARVYHELEEILAVRHLSAARGEEGGFAPDLENADAAVGLITEAIQKAGFRPGEDVALALNAAAGDLYDASLDCYVFTGGSAQISREIRRSPEEMISYLEELCQRYPIQSVEDALAENDWEGWKTLTDRLGGRVELIGGELFAANRERLAHGIHMGAGNAVEIRLDQVGTLTDLFGVAELARRNGYRTVVSNCRQETEDALIADLAVAFGAARIRAGAPGCTERVAKYNRLLRIEDSLGLAAEYESVYTS